jgi:hypothetical protein
MGSHVRVRKGCPTDPETVFEDPRGGGFSGCRPFAAIVLDAPHTERDLPDDIGIDETWARPKDPLGLIRAVEEAHPGYAENFVGCLKAVATDPDAWIVFEW